MYDMPEVRAETDRLWAVLRDALREAGFAAPDALTRPIADLWPHWHDPDLTLSQTCGLPYSAKLSGKVTLLGAPDYDLGDNESGHYFSQIIVRNDHPATSVKDLSGGRFAFNMRESQSGWAAPDVLLNIHETFDETVETGGHAASAHAVAEGRADVAAIDAVTWALLQRHDPVAVQLRIIGQTAATPGLPYISRLMTAPDAARMRSAVGAAVAALDKPACQALFLRGFVPLTDADYAPLAKGWGDAR